MTMNEFYCITSISNKDKDLKVCKLWSKDEKEAESVGREKIKQIVTENISAWMDALGEKSAVEQGLKVPITSFKKFLSSGTNPYSPVKLIDTIHLLLKIEAKTMSLTPLGFIRTGSRSLYFARDGELTQVTDCFSALDFYVEEQRQGYGLILFSEVLTMSNKKAVNCAIDRPSAAMLAFLKKHFSLDIPLEQHNRYVIFDGFFN